MSINLNDEQLKILILFSLRSAVSPIPQKTLGEILGICDINYFNIVPVLDDVVESGLVGRYETEDGAFLSLSEKGKEIAYVLRTQLPLALRQKVTYVTAIELQKLKKSLSVDTSVSQRINNGVVEYIVDLKLKDDGLDIIDLSMYCPTEMQAEMMAQTFRENADGIYKKILEIFIKR